MDFLKQKSKRRLVDAMLTKLGNMNTMLQNRENHNEILQELRKVDALFIELIKRIK